MGSPTVIADIDVSGTDPSNSELAARLWDVGPDGNQTLVGRALYRPAGNGRIVFQLHPNGWHFAGGHVPKLEILGNDDPYGRTSNFNFTTTVSNLDFRLPVNEKPGATSQVGIPAAPLIPPGATPTAAAARQVKQAAKDCKKTKKASKRHRHKRGRSARAKHKKKASSACQTKSKKAKKHKSKRRRR
jgi:hypothetical protein